MTLYPDFKTFKELSKRYKRVPVYAELIGDMETPVSAFLKLKKGSYNFLLESAEQEEKVGRYSFLGTNPELVIKGKGDMIEIYHNRSGEKQRISSKRPVSVIDKLLQDNRAPSYPSLPGFTGGLIGYFSYDFVRQVDKLPDTSPDKLLAPDFFFMLIENMVIFDHFKRKMVIVSNADTKDVSLKQAYERACQSIKSIRRQIEKPSFILQYPTPRASKQQFVSNISKKNFMKSVTKIKRYIQDDEILQAVISQKWQKKLDVSPFNIYRALRTINPSPYMFYLDAGEFKLVGSSPEILVKLDGKTATTRPIAGTRTRGKNKKEEEHLEKDLLADKKEIAEHLMLVDLGKADLEKVCSPKTVKVTDLMAIEKYSHVIHIVSNVEGTLKPRKRAIDLISATFPAGTVSGAPKTRAMEIIEGLEAEKRGPYAGAVGYFSLQGNMDFCITIRTFVVKGNNLSLQTGAGIVADSVPEKEYRETENKARGMIEAYNLAKKI